MSLKHSIAVLLGVLVVGLTTISYVTQRTVVLDEFLQIERKEAKADADRCVEAVLREVAHTSTTAADWAYWDETYRFIHDQNPEYRDSNLTATGLQNLRVNGLWLLAADGTVVASRTVDLATGEPLAFPDVPAAHFPADHPWLRISDLQGSAEGVVSSARGPLIYAARRILSSEKEGPARGTLIFARLVDPQLLARLREQTRVDFDLLDARVAELSAEDLSALRDPAALRNTLVTERDAERLAAYRALPDPQGGPGLLIRAKVARDISQQGQRATTYAAASILGAGTLTIGLLSLVLGLIVVRPLNRLTAHAAYVGASGDLTRGSGIAGADEIGTLAVAFDHMVGKLSDSQHALSETARKAGMADVARAVLHNVGNVLNNATVASSSIAQTVRQSRVSGFARAVALLDEHRADLGEYLVGDPQGKQLPDYLAQLVKVLAAERTAVMEDVARLSASLDHAARIIQQQRLLATTPELAERVTLGGLLQSLRSVVEDRLVQDGVACTWTVGDERTLTLDRTKVLQILVNLVTNAVEALAECPAGARRVEVTAHVHDDRVHIRVSDNGRGIAAGDLARIFQSGFTTKPSGTGLGLHYSANAAVECGGALTGHSEGEGHGASFLLQLPLRLPGASAEPA